jgi:hypothetical protein
MSSIYTVPFHSIRQSRVTGTQCSVENQVLSHVTGTSVELVQQAWYVTAASVGLTNKSREGEKNEILSKYSTVLGYYRTIT